MVGANFLLPVIQLLIAKCLFAVWCSILNCHDVVLQQDDTSTALLLSGTSFAGGQEMEHWLLGIANKVSWSTGLLEWCAHSCLSLLAAQDPSQFLIWSAAVSLGSAPCESGFSTEAACFKGKGGTTISSKSPDSMPYSSVSWWNFLWLQEGFGLVGLRGLPGCCCCHRHVATKERRGEKQW